MNRLLRGRRKDKRSQRRAKEEKEQREHREGRKKGSVWADLLTICRTCSFFRKDMGHSNHSILLYVRCPPCR